MGDLRLCAAESDLRYILPEVWSLKVRRIHRPRVVVYL